MHRATAAIVIATATWGVTSCALLPGLGEPSAPEPTYSSSGLLLSPTEVPGGGSWHEIDTEMAQVHFSERPTDHDSQTIEPPECIESRTITVPREGADVDLAALRLQERSGAESRVLAVVKGARSVDEIKDAREDCDRMTLDYETHVAKQTESVQDGPDIEGAEDTITIDTAWSTEMDGQTAPIIVDRTLVAEVRQTLVVSRVTLQTQGTGLQISDELKAEADEALRVQVDKVVKAP